MKNISLIASFLLILCFSSCKKEAQIKNNASIYIYMTQLDNLTGTAGQEHRVEGSIAIWREEGNTKIKVKSDIDAATGIGYDSVTDKKIEADFFGADSYINKDIPPGNYYIYVTNLYRYNVGLTLYSDKRITISEGQSIELKKKFIYPGTSPYQPWE